MALFKDFQGEALCVTFLYCFSGFAYAQPQFTLRAVSQRLVWETL
jgi:hypothetical protein